MSRKIEITAADTGQYIAGGNTTTGSNTFPGFTYSVSKGSYMPSSAGNLHYCTGYDSSGVNQFRLSGQSKSGKAFMYSSSGGIRDVGNVASSHSMTCSGLSNISNSYGYNGSNGGTWWPWTNG